MLSVLSPEGRISCAMLLAGGGLSDDARRRLDPEMNVRGYLDALLGAGQVSDALDVVARVLPGPSALQWGCDCLGSVRDDADGDAIERSALVIAKRWLDDPVEDNRQAALEVAERLAYRTPGAWLAAAAGWSDGSLLPAGQPEVPASAAMTGVAVAAALRLRAATDPLQYEPRLRGYIERALHMFADTPDAQGDAR